MPIHVLYAEWSSQTSIYTQSGYSPPHRLRVHHNTECMNYERFCRQLLSCQPWATDGFINPVCSKWVIDPEQSQTVRDWSTQCPAWTHIDVYPPSSPSTMFNLEPLVRLVYGMAVNGYYLMSLGPDSFQVDGGTVKLIEFNGFLNLESKSLYRPTTMTVMWALGFTGVDKTSQGNYDSRLYALYPNRRSLIRSKCMNITLRVLESAFGSDVDPIWSALEPSDFPLNDPGIGDIDEYITRKHELMPLCVARGSRGIIYRPPWPPADETSSLIGKVFWEDKEFDKELEGATMIERLDPQAKFHSRFVRADRLTPQMSQIVYEYAGIPIFKFKTVELRQFCEGLLQVLEGIETMRMAEVVHGDISSTNVLLDDKFKCRMIDYGFATRFDSFDWNFICAVEYPYFMPEIVVGTEPATASPLERFKKYLTESRGFVARWWSIIGEMSYGSYIEQLSNLPLEQRRMWMLRHFDLYSLGVVLIATPWWDQLRDVIRPMIVPKLDARSLNNSRDELVKLITRLKRS